VLTGPANETAPSEITWKDGVLYMVRESGVYAVPEMGGAPQKLVDGAIRRLWIEGDRIVYASGDRFSAVPLAGGTPQLLGDGKTESTKDALWVTAQALDESFFYWVRSDAYAATFWRMSRGGGSAEKLAAPAGVDWDARLAIFGDQLVAAEGGGKAYAIPKGGGDARALDVSSGWDFLGFDKTGALYGGSADPASVFRADPARGPAQAVAPSLLPRRLDVTQASPSTNGWFFAGPEPFADSSYRTSVWAVDSTEASAHRVACQADASSMLYVQAVTDSPSASFLSVWHVGEAEPHTWEIIRVPH
jgi:hypothetical protein